MYKQIQKIPPSVLYLPQARKNQGGEIQPPVSLLRSKEVVHMSNYELFMALLAVAGIVITLIRK